MDYNPKAELPIGHILLDFEHMHKKDKIFCNGRASQSQIHEAEVGSSY